MDRVHILVSKTPYLTTETGTGEEAYNRELSQMEGVLTRLGLPNLRAYLSVSGHHEVPSSPGVRTTTRRLSQYGQVITGFDPDLDFLWKIQGITNPEQKRVGIVEDSFGREVSEYVTGKGITGGGDKLIVVTPQFRDRVAQRLEELGCEIVDLSLSSR